jgi:alpha-beta hydrolase superfamily lysophospholipase
MMRYAKIALVAFVAFHAIAGFVVAPWLITEGLTAPVPRTIGPPPDALREAESITFESLSERPVHAWRAPGRPGRGTVVLAHAVRSDRRSLVDRAVFLQHAGYGVLLYDAQAHGESPGERITFGYREALDATAAVALARRDEPASPVAFIGVSQGGASALLGPEPLAVDALVIEAVYPTLAKASANRIALRFGAPGRWLAPLLLWPFELRLGVAPEDVAPIEKIREVEAPLLVVAGERDQRTTLADTRALFTAAPEPKSLWIVPGAGHEDFHDAAPAAYERRILDFLARALADASERHATTPRMAARKPTQR